MADQTGIDYIKSSLAQGKKKEVIYQELLTQGWSIDAIENAFAGHSTEVEKVDSQHRTVQIIVTIGALLVGAGIFSFIAANWAYMDRTVKVAIILCAMLVAYAFGWYAKEKAGYIKTGEALILLGAIIYGSGIFLVAQMFNIRANWPDGFILWALGTLVLAFATESYLLYYLAIPLAFAALIGHPFGIFMAFGHDPFLLTSSILLLVATATTFATGWHMRSKIPLEIKETY